MCHDSVQTCLRIDAGGVPVLDGDSGLGPGGGPFPPLSEFEGLQTAVNRGYELDFSALEAGDEDFRDALFLGGFVLEFDSSDNAAAGYDELVSHGIVPLVSGMGITDPEVVETDREDLGDQAHAMSVFNQASSTEGYVRDAVMHAETYVFMSMIMTEAEESSLDADALLAYFAEGVGKEYTGVGTHVPEGGSTGASGISIPRPIMNCGPDWLRTKMRSSSRNRPRKVIGGSPAT